MSEYVPVTGHRARAVRRNGPGTVWFAVCPQGCVMPRANSKEHAEWLSTLHRASMLACSLRCECYDPDELEYDPGGKCIACQLNDVLAGAA